MSAWAITSAVGACFVGTSGFAANGTWVPTAGGTYNWDVNGAGTNWTGSTFPNGSAETAAVNNNIVGDQTIHLNLPIQVSTLTLGDSAGVFNNFTIATGSGGSLTIGTGDLTSQNGHNVINAPLWLGAASGVIIQHSTGFGSLTINDGVSHTGNASFQLGGGGGRVVVNGGITIGTGTLTIGTGVTTLNGLGSYSGGVLLNASGATLNLGHAGALGSGLLSLGATTLNGQTIDNTSGGAMTVSSGGGVNFASFIFAGSNDLHLGNSPMTFNSAGARTVILNGVGRTLTFGGTVTPSVTSAPQQLTVYGRDNTIQFGGWNLVHPSDTSGRSQTMAGNADITFTGGVVNGHASNINSLVYAGYGTMALRGSNSFLGTLRASSGRVVVDYANAAGGTSSNYGLNAATTLSAGFGTVELRGKAGAGNITLQTVGDIASLNETGQAKFVFNRNGGDGMTVNAGALTRATGTSMYIDLSSGATLTTSTLNNSGTGMINVSGPGLLIVKDQANRIDYLRNKTNAVGGEVGALNASNVLPTSGANSSLNYKLEGGLTLAASQGANSLRITTTAPGQTLDIGANNLGVTAIGLLFAGDHDYTIAGTTGRVSDNAGGANTQLFLNNFGAGKLTMTARMASGTSNVAFVGNGSLTDWNSASNASGVHRIFDQTVRLSFTGTDAINLTNASTTAVGQGNIIMFGGILELSAADFTRGLGSGNGQITLNGNSGFSAFGSDRAVLLSAANPLVWGTTAGFIANGASLVLGSEYSNRTLDFQNNIDLGTINRQVDVFDGADDGVNGAVIDGRLSGVLSGAAGLVKTGTGALAISNNNSYAGGTSVREGRVLATGSGALGTGGVDVLEDATLELTVNTAIADTAAVVIDDGGTLVLNMPGTWASNADNELVASLTLDGTVFNTLTHFTPANDWNGYGNDDGFFAGSTGGLTVVPEPASLSLLMLGGAGLLRRRRRHS